LCSAVDEGWQFITNNVCHLLLQHWPVFKEVSELFILVPALLGLKGNLDMCLASRLSTQANLGNMVSAKDIWGQVVGNVALVQVKISFQKIKLNERIKKKKYVNRLPDFRGFKYIKEIVCWLNFYKSQKMSRAFVLIINRSLKSLYSMRPKILSLNFISP